MSFTRSLGKSYIYFVVVFLWTAFLRIKIQLVIWKLLIWWLLVPLSLYLCPYVILRLNNFFFLPILYVMVLLNC